MLLSFSTGLRNSFCEISETLTSVEHSKLKIKSLTSILSSPELLSNVSRIEQKQHLYQTACSITYIIYKTEQNISFTIS